jgi:hypothetical protein
MRVRGIWLFVLGAMALATPAIAHAATKPDGAQREIQQPRTTGVVYLGHANGYEVSIWNPSSHVAILFVDRLVDGEDGRGNSYTQTTYAVRPQSSIGSGLLRARFGSIGTVKLHFRSGGKTKVGKTDKGCRGRAPEREDGIFRGAVKLEGEGGYFSLVAHRARGILSRSFRLSCTPGHALKDISKPLFAYAAPNYSIFVTSNGGSIAMLLATSRQRSRAAFLRAAHMQGEGPGAELQAGALELTPGVAVGHSAYAVGGEGTLLTSLPGVHPATATLAPPPPFYGEASFHENSATSHSWSGTLGVSFPGLDLPLTGPSYATSLCVSSPFKTPQPCDFQKLPQVAE